MRHPPRPRRPSISRPAAAPAAPAAGRRGPAAAADAAGRRADGGVRRRVDGHRPVAVAVQDRDAQRQLGQDWLAAAAAVSVARRSNSSAMDSTRTTFTSAAPASWSAERCSARSSTSSTPTTRTCSCRRTERTRRRCVEPQVKATPGMNIQDAFATAKPFGDVFKVDVGYMLPPLAHNAVQGAGTLYSWDYFANSFNSGNVVRQLGQSRRARRRRPAARLGAGQSPRVPRRSLPGLAQRADRHRRGRAQLLRFAARLQINLLDPETGFFYAGTYLGAKRILSIGGSIDIQDSYRYYAGDIFADMPAGAGVFTAQVERRPLERPRLHRPSRRRPPSWPRPGTTSPALA